MDGVAIQARINQGNGKAATAIGSDFEIYRPSVPSNPISLGNYVATIKASFNAKDSSYSRPYTERITGAYGVLDATNVLVGDYLVGSEGTFCFVEKSPILPYYFISCPRTVSIYRQSYAGGVLVDTEVALNIPCSISMKRSRVPQDITGSLAIPLESARTSWSIWACLPLGTVERLDKLVDDLGVVYIVDAPYHNSEFYELAASVYSTDTDTIQRTINDIGYTITLRTLTQGAYDPATGSAISTYANTSRRGVVTDFTTNRYGTTLITQSRIETGDVRCLMDASGTAPAVSSRVIANSVEYSVIEVKTVNTAGATVEAYELLLRR